MFLRTYRTYVRCFFLRYFLCKSVCPSEGGTAHVRKTLVRFWTPLSCCLVILLFVFVLIFFPARVTDLAWPEVVSCLSFSRTFFFFSSAVDGVAQVATKGTPSVSSFAPVLCVSCPSVMAFFCRSFGVSVF